MQKVRAIAPKGEPVFLKTLPGIKPAEYVIQSPDTMNVMAKRLASGRLQNERAMIEATNAVLETYGLEKKQKVEVPSSNLRGAAENKDVGFSNKMGAVAGTVAAGIMTAAAMTRAQ